MALTVVKFPPGARLLRASSAVDATVVPGHHNKEPDDADFVAALKRGNPSIEVVINSSIQVRLSVRPMIVAQDHMHGIYQEGNATLDVHSCVWQWLPLRVGVPNNVFNPYPAAWLKYLPMRTRRKPSKPAGTIFTRRPSYNRPVPTTCETRKQLAPRWTRPRQCQAPTADRRPPTALNVTERTPR